MAQDITLMGASYSDVPAVELPKTGGGLAKFTDVSDTTAETEDVKAGMVFFNALGQKKTGTSGDGLSQNAKNALLDCFRHLIWESGQGREYYNALYEALGGCESITLDRTTFVFGSVGETVQLTATTDLIDGAVTWSSSDISVATVTDGLIVAQSVGTVTITATCGTRTAMCNVTVEAPSSIEAVYTQSGRVFANTTLDELKNDLVVTARWTNDLERVITDYTLSGTIAVGTCLITVTYGDLIDVFTVNVETTPLYNWDFTKSVVDTINGNEAELLNGLTQSLDGLNYNAVSQSVRLPGAYRLGMAIEIDVTDFDIQSDDDRHVRFVMRSDSSGMLIWRYNGSPAGWSSYQSSVGWSSRIYGNLTQKNSFANCTIRIEVSDTGISTLYKDGVLIDSSTSQMASTTADIWIGSADTSEKGANLYNAKITGVRVY